MNPNILSKEEQVIKKRWEGPIPSDDASYVEKTLYSLSRKNNDDFSVEDLRFIILQEIGLDIYIPKAICVLSQNILAEGDFYEGDLLSSVLQVPMSFWQDHEELRCSVYDLICKNEAILLESELPKRVKRNVLSFIQSTEVNNLSSQ
jgi:hypothetical protein